MHPRLQFARNLPSRGSSTTSHIDQIAGLVSSSIYRESCATKSMTIWSGKLSSLSTDCLSKGSGLRGMVLRKLGSGSVATSWVGFGMSMLAPLRRIGYVSHSSSSLKSETLSGDACTSGLSAGGISSMLHCLLLSSSTRRSLSLIPATCPCFPSGLMF